MFTDVACATISIPVIRNPQMPRYNKFELHGIAERKLAFSYRSHQRRLLPVWLFNNDRDQRVNILGSMQIHVGSIATSVTALKPLFRRNASSFKTSKSF
ncbi:unnamed protein product [Alternaria burnsii]|nr:unnamed protein product [Alternaria burnsii]